MPTELEELVGFLHHGNTQIRQISVENLVPYSKTQPAIFRALQMTPVTDLKLLIKDYPVGGLTALFLTVGRMLMSKKPIARNALTILVNISSDDEILKELAEDEAFLEALLLRVTSAQEPNGDLLAMLLANLAKHPSLERLITLRRAPVPALSPSPLAITQLLDLFNTGPTGTYNENATYEYLTYLFADFAKYPSFQTYLTTPPSASSSPKSELDPLTTFLPLTTHPSHPRRLGTATLLRNIALAHSDPLYLLQPAHSILPSLLLPLCSSDQSNITSEEMEMLPEECQFLTPGEDDKEERDVEIVKLLLETLYLVTARGGKEGADVVRENGGYVVVRECHLRWEEEAVRGACERIVDVLMVGEEEEAEAVKGGFVHVPATGAGGKNIRGSGLLQASTGGGIEGTSKPKAKEDVRAVERRDEVEDADDEDEDNAIVPIF